jgi:hypothetical protein
MPFALRLPASEGIHEPAKSDLAFYQRHLFRLPICLLLPNLLLSLQTGRHNSGVGIYHMLESYIFSGLWCDCPTYPFFQYLFKLAHTNPVAGFIVYKLSLTFLRHDQQYNLTLQNLPRQNRRCYIRPTNRPLTKIFVDSSVFYRMLMMEGGTVIETVSRE